MVPSASLLLRETTLHPKEAVAAAAEADSGNFETAVVVEVVVAPVVVMAGMSIEVKVPNRPEEAEAEEVEDSVVDVVAVEEEAKVEEAEAVTVVADMEEVAEEE